MLVAERGNVSSASRWEARAVVNDAAGLCRGKEVCGRRRGFRIQHCDVSDLKKSHHQEEASAGGRCSALLEGDSTVCTSGNKS